MTSDMNDAMHEPSPPIACGLMCEVITGATWCDPDAWVELGAQIIDEPGFVTPPEEAAQAALLLWLYWRMNDPNGDHWTYCKRTQVESVAASVDYLQERVDFYDTVPAAADLAAQLGAREPDPYEACERWLRVLARGPRRRRPVIR